MYIIHDSHFTALAVSWRMSSEDKDETIKDGVDESHAAKHEAIVKLEEVDVKSGEEDENELLKL